MHIENLTPFAAQTTLSFDPDGREMVVMVCKGTYDIPTDPDAPCTLSADQVPLQMADELADDAALTPILETDFSPFKPQCDVVVLGPAHAPDGKPVKAMAVGLQLGKLAKSFHVIGPRIWQKRVVGHVVSEPQPFTTQAIGYAQAWGGADPHPSRDGHFATIETNPSGVGYHPYTIDIAGKPLPNTEERGRIVDATDGPFLPQAFGPIGRVWLPRRQYAGTYDDHWQNTRMPFPPKDLNSRFFQSVPPDQQISYPQGGEAFSIKGMAPEGDVVGKLPDTKVAFRFARKSGRLTQKVGTLDTVVFMPAQRRLTLVWRAHLIPERDMFDIGSVTVMAK